MNLTETELKILKRLQELDCGDMQGAHWPVRAIVRELGLEIKDQRLFAIGLEREGLVSLEGGAPCAAITQKGREAIEKSC